MRESKPYYDDVGVIPPAKGRRDGACQREVDADVECTAIGHRRRVDDDDYDVHDEVDVPAVVVASSTLAQRRPPSIIGGDIIAIVTIDEYDEGDFEERDDAWAWVGRDTHRRIR